ncbi:MAG: type III-B CRISPR module-associated protein Cmr5 [Desulfobulbaceae bacterium]|nr:type III-B CRISPR module-associated protein Cmr5 [Desulfobulbaceae bacterium]
MTGPGKERTSLGQQRMRFVYERFTRSGVSKDDAKTLKQVLKGLPVSLRTNGLAVVTARLAADRDVYAGEYLLAEWLLKECPLFAGMAPQFRDNKSSGLQRLMAWCMEMSRLEYEAVQQESMRLAEQAKLIAEALWPEKK